MKKTHVRASASLTDHVVLISIDGLRPDIYRDERWPAPVLHELALSDPSAASAQVLLSIGTCQMCGP